ncbi:MAG TPA: 4a-hydroxytetrahydrobiopterin dehydratase [Pirellulales bacterium]|jgi:4a-hydroxytetrahydrobiopterin dehydratase|nr:4a-hydroxytetrahydrobiopterin dehydratase [Pirellulales bacterium]
MTAQTAEQLTHKKCKPCEGGVQPYTAAEAAAQVQALPDWKLTADGKAIERRWVVKDFLTAMKFFDAVAKIAETDQHHPDLHLTGYRNVRIELSTHAIGGLSENDFILAAKIDKTPVELKKK